MNAIVANLAGQVLSNPIVVGLATLAAGSLVVIWLLAVAWVFREMSHRSDKVLARYLAASWILVSGPVLLPLSVGAYMLARPHEFAGERRITRLLDAVRARASMTPSCPACAETVDERWVRCPVCTTWLGRQCVRCERWAPYEATICPWCAYTPGEAVDVGRLVPDVGRLVPVGARQPVTRDPVAATVRQPVPATVGQPAPATVGQPMPAGAPVTVGQAVAVAMADSEPAGVTLGQPIPVAVGQFQGAPPVNPMESEQRPAERRDRRDRRSRLRSRLDRRIEARIGDSAETGILPPA